MRPDGGVSYRVARSSEGGQTWSAPVAVAQVPFAAFKPLAVTTAPEGSVYAAWADPGGGKVMVVRSPDAGASWGQRVTAASEPGAEEATVAADSRGRLGLMWYDRRNPGPGQSAEAWFAFSTDRALTWRQIRPAGLLDLETNSTPPVPPENPLGWADAMQPDLRAKLAPDETIALLFSDIEGSTTLNATLGDRRWLEVLREHNAVLRHAIRKHRGYEVKSQGDGFMIAFAKTRSALDCAIAMQRELAIRNETTSSPLLVRIGIHTGEAIRQDGDFFGLNVALASRVASSAAGGEILVSQTVTELPESADLSFELGPEVELKGMSGTWPLYRIAWQAD